MKTFIASTLALLPFAVALPAQEGMPPEGMPNPKTEHHEHFAMLVGNWRTHTKTPAMPGVEGMEKATESVGFERAELICNGLWLKCTGSGEWAGEPTSGIWLLGYDPYAETYKCMAASSMEEAMYTFTAKFDVKAKTWHFQGDTPQGLGSVGRRRGGARDEGHRRPGDLGVGQVDGRLGRCAGPALCEVGDDADHGAGGRFVGEDDLEGEIAAEGREVAEGTIT